MHRMEFLTEAGIPFLILYPGRRRVDYLMPESLSFQIW